MAEEVSVRLSHLLSVCSVGAIVRGSESLMVVQDISTWDLSGGDPLDREIQHVARVQKALGISHALCTPPIESKRNGRSSGWIPALRFPTWMSCVKCGYLHSAPWRRQRLKEEEGSIGDLVRCSRKSGEGHVCGGKLEQTPWVLIHEKGYLGDAPWHDLAHRGSRDPQVRQCKRDWSVPYLWLNERPEGRQLCCSRCKAKANFSRIVGTKVSFPCNTWQQPWIREAPADVSSQAWLVEINDVRVHSPSTRSALVIPPESRIRQGTVTDRLYSSATSRQKVQRAKTDLARRSACRQIAGNFRCTPEEVMDALEEIDRGYPMYGQEIVVTDLLVDEFQVLCEEIPDLREDEDFVTEHHTNAWRELGQTLESGASRRAASAVTNLVAVNRLKEIMVFTGFSRAGGDVAPPDIFGRSNWLPALKLYGEGMFFTLDEEMLERWESVPAIQDRAQEFCTRHSMRPAYGGIELEVSPRFLLCHTLAHLLIRELEASAGYPAASLKERIYCSTGDEPMAGILIYVAVPDEEGSLGGLMDLARPRRFLRLWTKVFESAAWCSFDPVCCEQEGHGPDLLNRAACHACTLVPETSCQYGNVLLDRVFVNGAKPDLPAFLDFAEQLTAPSKA
ncbi:MAG: DUF1998 domain-containing protein [Rhodobacteraceae bacterium]|nr:DUF1998 domain-containing protein [Paracoccaceae bacterium]